MKPRVAAALIVLAPSIARAQVGALDQVSPIFPPGPGGGQVFNVGVGGFIWRAQVRCGLAGQLEGARIGLENATPGTPQTGVVRLRAGTAVAPGPWLAAFELVQPGSGPLVVFADFTAAGLRLEAGETFVLEFQGDGSHLTVFGNCPSPPGSPPLYPEPLYLSNSPIEGCRIGFETFMLVDGVCRPDLTFGAIAGAPGYGAADGVLNNDDFFYYMSQYAAGNLAVADLTNTAIPVVPGYGVPDGVLDMQDFFYYLDLFARGC